MKHISFKFIILLFSALPPMLYGQGVINDGASIVISSGTTLNIVGGSNGNFKNTNVSNGSIDIDGEMIVEGDWTNNATGGNVFVNRDADGTIEIKGSTAQTIGGSRATIFENLTINNSTSGSAVTLGGSNDQTVEGTLTLTDGIVATGSNTLYVNNTAHNAVTGYSDTCFIYGNLKRDITNNTETYEFPVGKTATSTDYHPMDFINNNITGTTNLTAYIQSISETGDNIDANLNTSEDGTDYANVLSDAAWDITENPARTGGSYGVNLYVTNVADLSSADDNEFSVLKRTSGSTDYDEWNSFDGSTIIPAADVAGRIYNSGNGYAQKTGFTSFSEFVIAKSNNIPLPIELLNFKGDCNNDSVFLIWTTVSETNNDYFLIENSDDGLLFSEIAKIKGKGNYNGLSEYQWFDRDNHGDYYRLKQVDFDGQFNYSDIIFFKCPDCDPIEIYPNPADNYINIKYNGNIVIEILSLGSQTLISTRKKSIDISHLSPSIYMILIKDENGNVIKNKKLIIY